MRKTITAIAKISEADSSQISKEIAPLLALLRKKLKALKLSATVIVGGSIAKGTVLKDDYDVDLFVAFAKKHSNEDLSNLLEKVMKATKLKYNKVHGSRDYFQTMISKTLVEIVPVLKVKSRDDSLNVTDMSPLHVVWVKKNLNPKLAGDIRAAKLFCKHERIYGAESYIKGFSGHVLDILVIHYKGLDKLLKAASSWKPQVIIDPANYHNGKTRFLMNKSKLGPLVIVDPTDKSRNAAAAVGEDALKKFIFAARKFVKKPSGKFFEPFNFSLDKLARASKKEIILVIPSISKGKRDVVGAKLLKQFEKITTALDEYDFKSINDWYWDKSDFCIFWFKIEPKTLPLYREHEGPQLERKEHCVVFKKKYPTAKKKSGRLVAKVKNVHRTPEDLINAVLKGSKSEILVKKA